MTATARTLLPLLPLVVALAGCGDSSRETESRVSPRSTASLHDAAALSDWPAF